MRVLDELCSVCNKPKEMYYEPWCPRCEKPEFKTIRTLNLIQALEHVAVVKGESRDPLRGYPRRFKTQLFDTYGYSNDSFFTYFFGDEELDPEPRDADSAQFVRDEKLLMEVFGFEPGDSVVFEVSW